jgi:hypothetical protein
MMCEWEMISKAYKSRHKKGENEGKREKEEQKTNT